MEEEKQEYTALFNACYMDNFEKVKVILDEFPDIDLNAPLLPSISRRNGTALIYTGNAKIGKLLIEKGALVNHIHKNNLHSFTALDSAENTLKKMNDSDERKIMIEDYIAFLIEHKAKRFSEIKKEGGGNNEKNDNTI